MKKLYLIIFLVLANISLLCVRIFSNKLKKIELNLKEGEVAVIILSLEESKSFLLSSKNGNLLYTFSYKDDQNLEQNISLFTDNLDYVFMKHEYPLSYPNKTVLDGLVVIQNIQLEPNRLHYNNRIFKIDYSALTVGKSAVVKNLQKHVKHVGVRLFNFVEQNYAVRLSSYLFGKLTAV